MTPIEEAQYINFIIESSQKAMGVMSLEFLEYAYEQGKITYEKLGGKMPFMLDSHPVDDQIISLEIQFLGQLIQCIKLQRQMAPLKEITANHRITLQQKVHLQ